MRCISQYREFKIGLREHIKEDFATGKSRILQHGVLAEFRHFGTLPHEKEMARQRFRFNGTYQLPDEVTLVDPVDGNEGWGVRLSVFDTDWPELVTQWEQWDRLEQQPKGTIKAEVEQRLRDMQGEAYFVVEAVKLPPPWPKYDTLRSAAKIAQTVADLGIDPVAVLAYERQESGRDDVIAALEALLQPAEGEELVAA